MTVFSMKKKQTEFEIYESITEMLKYVLCFSTLIVHNHNFISPSHMSVNRCGLKILLKFCLKDYLIFYISTWKNVFDLVDFSIISFINGRRKTLVEDRIYFQEFIFEIILKAKKFLCIFFPLYFFVLRSAKH